VQLVVLDLNEVVKDLDKMLRRLIDENIEMTIVPGKEIGRIKADSGYVGQVLMNLVVNARDAMPNGGKLTIATSNVTLDENIRATHPGAIPGDYVMLSVSDTGTGMTDEVKARCLRHFSPRSPRAKAPVWAWRPARPSSNNPAATSAFTASWQRHDLQDLFSASRAAAGCRGQPIQTGPLPRGTETLLVVEDEPSVRHLARERVGSPGL
jgi:hypothetical protein